MNAGIWLINAIPVAMHTRNSLSLSSIRTRKNTHAQKHTLAHSQLGHELLHKPLSSRASFPRLTRSLWTSLVLIQNGYLVYIWEHRFHHKHAGTDLDLASTRRHTSMFVYLGRYPTHIRNSLRHFPSALVATSVVMVVYVVGIAMVFSRATAMIFCGMMLINW